MIYVLKLQNDRYFLLKTTENKSDGRLLLEAEILYDYPKLYLPEYLYATYNDESTVDLDRYVKTYMIWFGIENVRGGSYLLPELPDYQQRSLFEEMNTAANDTGVSDLIEYANQPHTKEELATRLTELQTNYAKYKAEKKLQLDIDCKKMRENLQWLNTECENQKTAFFEKRTESYLFKLEKRDAVKKYRIILVDLMNVRTIIKKDLQISIDDPIIAHPEFVLDDFLYHHNRMNVPTSSESLSRFIDKYNYYLDIIENRKAERDYDIESWGKDAEYRMPREIYLLKRLCRIPSYL